MLKPLNFSLSLALSLTAFLASLKAAEITFLGTDNATKENWRTTTVNKPSAFDPNGDRVYGTDGYYVVKATGGNAQGVDSSLPAYVTSADYSSSNTYAASGYRFWDDPTVTPGATVADRNYGLFYGSYSPVKFTLSAAKKFVLMIPIGGNETTHYPTSLSVTQVGGEATTTAATNLPTRQNPLQVSYIFFEIDGAAGDVFKVDINGSNIQNLSVGGFAWEEIAPKTPGAGMLNRWSFNGNSGNAGNGTVFTDSVSGQAATVVGNGATQNANSITLPGSSSQGQNNANVAANNIAAYIDLPNGIISSKKNLTLEIWSTTITAQNQTRLFDFGRMNIAGVGAGAEPGEVTNASTTAPGGTSASDSIALLPNLGTNINTQQLEARLNGGGTISTRPGLTASTDVEYHDAFIFEDGLGNFGSQGGRLSWFRNGNFVDSIDLNFHLSDLEDVNNWLGRSMWSNDYNANISFNELRIHERALTVSELSDSYSAGPDASFPAPIAQADSVTMNPLQKVSLDVLANDSGAINPATLTIQNPPAHGTASVTTDGKILYTNTTNSSLPDTFTYTVGGAGGASAPATVTVNFTNNLRIPTVGFNVPAAAPATAYQLENAFGNLQFTQPVSLVTPPGEDKRLFVCEKTGVLKVIQDVTAMNPTSTVFFDLPAYLLARGENIESPSEQGLLSVAFHPDYATNGYFYLFYSVDPVGSNATFERISRFTVRADNPNLADTSSELVLIQQIDESANHNGGDMHFGADGYLYISLGDEGAQNDARNNSQRITKDFFSAILRIDVDNKPGNLQPNAHPNPAQSAPAVNAIPMYETFSGSGNYKAAYSIPIDNPYITVAQGGDWDGTFNGSTISAANLPYVRSEFWSVGYRNPWRMSFDPQTDELWVGDVGQDAREEVLIATRGGNHGWNYREGFIARPGSGTPPAGFTSLDPLYDYSHGNGNFQGNSITGGLVYRGDRFIGLKGAYIFSDYVSGNIWSLRRNGAAAPTVKRITGESNIVAFGKDPSNGDVLLANLSSGRIRRLVSGNPDSSFPATLSATGLFADLNDLSPNPGLLPYDVNLPFWSDHAEKRRFFAMPDQTAMMTWKKEEPWIYPTGQIWVKHFDMPLIRSNPPLASDPTTPSKRIETRLMVKTETGVYGVSYRWNDAGTEAILSPEEGENFDIDITQDGAAYTQRWSIPSRANCITCHTPQGGHSLSMNTRQFNLVNSINGANGNQIDILKNAGFFSNSPQSTRLLPKHFAADDTSETVEARVRSYLAVNCAYCHQPGGTSTPAAWDGRTQITLEQMEIINANAVNNGGDPQNKLIVPGNHDRSVIYNRVAEANGFTRMPAIGSNELDPKNIALLKEWINGSLSSRQSYDAWRLDNFSSGTSPIGLRENDADGDGVSNYDEFIAGTDPNSANSFFKLKPSLENGVWSLEFQSRPNRLMQVEKSTDLTNWSLWDVPGNAEVPRNGNWVTITGAAPVGPVFFRVNMREN